MEYNSKMDQVNSKPTELSAAQQGRRELVTKLGKFAVYAAPFTVMALNSKAATSSGPGPHAKQAPAGH